MRRSSDCKNANGTQRSQMGGSEVGKKQMQSLFLTVFKSWWGGTVRGGLGWGGGGGGVVTETKEYLKPHRFFFSL